MTSLFSDFEDISKNEENNIDNVDSIPIEHASDEEGDANSAPSVDGSHVTSSTLRSQRTIKGLRSPLMMSDLITVVGEMASAIKNSTHWTEIVYAKVMEA